MPEMGEIIMKILLKVIISFLFRVKTVDFDKLNMSGRVIIMPNHTSFLDGVFLYLFLPKEAVYVVNSDVAQRFALALKFAKHITIDPLNPFSMRKIISVVNEGVPVVLFPEGRITTTKGLMKIYDGIGFVALKTQAVIYPLIINGLEYSKASRITDKVKSRWFPKVRLSVHEPFQLVVNEHKSLRIQEREASDKILAIMQNALFASRYTDNVNLFEELINAAGLFGWNTEIMEDIKQKVSYKQLLLVAYILARKFKSIIGPEEKNIGLLLPNSIAHVSTLFSLFFLNKTPAILNFTAGTQTVADCSETAGIKTVISSLEFIEKGDLSQLAGVLESKYRVIYLEDVRSSLSVMDKLAGLLSRAIRKKPLAADSHRLILFTSGTENKPKGVVLKHSNLTANVLQVTSVIDIHGKDTILNSLPMFHSFGLTAGTFLPLLSGMPVFLYPSPLHYKIIPEVIYDKNITFVFGTSTFLSAYGNNAHPYDFYKVRYVFAGAEKLKPEVRALWQSKFGIRIFEGYGCTETAPILSLNTPLAYRGGSVGRFLPGIQHRVKPVEGIAEGGSLEVKGPNVMEGYLLHECGLVRNDEWYDTGDIVEVDEEGFINIKSRLKRFAKIGGEMVSLNLVEELAERCFGTDGFYATLTLPDSKKGEKIVLAGTTKNLSVQVFIEFLAKNGYNMFLCPADMVVLENIPLLGSGKTDYLYLRNLLS